MARKKDAGSGKSGCKYGNKTYLVRCLRGDGYEGIFRCISGRCSGKSRKLFDLVAQSFPDKDTGDFIKAYMSSKTRKSIDEAKAYVNTMDARELWGLFYGDRTVPDEAGKVDRWIYAGLIGEFYAYYQWYYNIPSAELVKKILWIFLKKHTMDCTIWNWSLQSGKWGGSDACDRLSQSG